MRGEFAGERPENQMKKARASKPTVNCGQCRMFDGTAWCRHWNFHTTNESPPCSFFRKMAARPAQSSIAE